MDLGGNQTAIGALVLLVSTVLIFAIVQFSVPVLLGSLAAIGMAAGALLIGTDGTGRPV